MAKSTCKYVTYIRTTPQTLWHALTTPEVIKRYWFGIEPGGDWKVGSRWSLSYDGRLMDSGDILESVAPKRLARSWRNEWKPEFKAEGTSLCVYEIEEMRGCAKLTITHSMEREHSKFIDAVAESWPMCISNLKSLLETGDVALADHPGH